jgi:hypothetical protein
MPAIATPTTNKTEVASLGVAVVAVEQPFVVVVVVAGAGSPVRQ